MIHRVWSLQLREEGVLRQLAICVPVRNEEDELPGLFAALERLKVDPGIVVHICLLLDACTDRSVALAAVYRGSSQHAVHIDQVATPTGRAGHARQLACALGLLVGRGAADLLLTTDADSRPEPNWLRAMTAALDLADVVAGRIVRGGVRPSPAQDRVEAYYDALYALRRRLDPVTWEAEATHHHAGGANLGFRGDAYRTLGGFAPVASGEDARIVDEAERAGLRVRRDAACLVLTSDRRLGRARHGLASALRQLDRDDVAAVTVTHPVDAAWQYRHQARARFAYRQDRLALLVPQIGLTLDHLRGVARDCPNAEAFAMRVVPTAPGGMRHIGLAEAEIELARLVTHREAA